MSISLNLPRFLKREDIRRHKEIIFVFGDNLRQLGDGGQAYACRREPNAFGVPTKKLPCMQYPHAFFLDHEIELINIPAIDAAIERIPNDGRQVYVIPGIGKGLSRLDEYAPKTYLYLLEKLKAIPNRIPGSL